MKKIYLVTLCLIALITGVSIQGAWAQQDAQFTHYMFNTQSVNPAYAGSREALTVTGLHRSQWVGFDGAPVTQTITLHSPVAKDRVGLGLSLIQDKIGPTKTQSAYADFAYRIPVGEKANLALGLKAGVNIMKNDLTKLSLNDNGDDSFSKNISSDLLPNFGFGIYYHTPRFYAGLGAPKLLENDFETGISKGGANPASEKRHYFLTAGTVLDLSTALKLKPTTLVKMVNGAPVEFDLTGTLLIHDKFWLGAMWRTTDALGLLVGFNFTEQLAMGYSFDYSYGNETFNYNDGSHEIMLRYDFIFNDKARIKSPRYF